MSGIDTIKYHKNTRKQNIHESEDFRPFQQVITRLQETDNTAYQRQTWNINNNNDPQKRHRLETVNKKYQ